MSECATPLDDRIDTQLLALNQRATGALPEYLAGVRVEHVGGLPVNCADLWVAYLAAELYGNADATLVAISHNRGRQARILVRQMFENRTKARYYAANPEPARLEFLSWPFRDLQLCEQYQLDPASIRVTEAQKAIDNISAKFPEVATYAKSTREASLKQMVDSMHATAVESDHEYAFHYRRLSQTSHGTIPGMGDVLDFGTDGKLGIRFDSRLDDPNFEVQLMTIYILDYLRLLNDQFSLGRETEIEAMEQESSEILARLYPGQNLGVHDN